jgi:hypothetical protein
MPSSSGVGPSIQSTLMQLVAEGESVVGRIALERLGPTTTSLVILRDWMGRAGPFLSAIDIYGIADRDWHRAPTEIEQAGRLLATLKDMRGRSEVKEGFAPEGRPLSRIGAKDPSLGVRVWLLREVCIHFLMNRRVTTDERAQIQRKQENFDTWEGWVVDTLAKAGLSELELSRFRSLGILPRQFNPDNPDHALLEDIIREKYQRFEAIVRDLQASGKIGR